MLMDISTYRKKHGLSQAEFAGLLVAAGYNATQVLISQWEKEGAKVPAIRCVQVEEVTRGKVKRRTLRPDLFGRAA